MHHPDGDLSDGGENQVDLDRCVPDILGIHPIWAPQEVKAALMTIAVEEDRHAREGGPVLPSGQTGAASEQIGGKLDVRRIAQEIDVAADDLRRRETTIEQMFELAGPDGDSLSSDENDVLLADDILQTRDDPFSLSEAQLRRLDLLSISRYARGL
jgi:hypothetical protein